MRQFLRRWFIFLFVQMNPKAKCPACGIRAKHDLLWTDVYKAVMHHCGQCKAVWAEKPIVEATNWAVERLPEPEVEQPKNKIMGIQR